MSLTEQYMKEFNLDTITCPIHSFETFGAVDGPGIRFVIFTQGCNLKCKYCQNRDTWCHKGGTTYSVRQVLDKIETPAPQGRWSSWWAQVDHAEPHI